MKFSQIAKKVLRQIKAHQFAPSNPRIDPQDRRKARALMCIR